MKRTHKLLGLITALLVLVSVPAVAGDIGPVIPKAIKGKQCVEETTEMRKNHMDYLKSHRDATLREGIRTKQYSLKACLDCHVPAEATAASEKEGHFCKNCHEFAGVSFDCFQCHSTRPENSAENMMNLPATLNALKGIHTNSSILLNQMASNKNRTGAIQ